MTKKHSARLRMMLLTVISVIAVLTTSVVAAQTDVPVTLTPATSTVEVGDTFTIAVTVEAGSTEIDSAGVSLAFDETVLQVVSTTAGTAFTQPLIAPNPQFDNAAGTIDYNAGAPFGSTLPTGNVELLTIEFEAIAVGTATIDFNLSGNNLITAPVGQDVTGTLNSASVTVNAPAAAGCSPISTLDCDEIEVSLPYDLTFDGSEGGLSSTGFTMVDPPSINQFPPTPSNPDVPGYEPSLIDVSGGVMTITSTQGINYLAPPQSSDNNTQVNALGVGFQPDGEFEIIIELDVIDWANSSGNQSQQAGIWFGLDEDNFVKLVFIKDGDTTGNVEMRVETGGNSTNSDRVITGSAVSNAAPMTLRLLVDPATGDVTGFYTVSGGTEQSLPSLTLPQAYFDGLDHDSNGATAPLSYAGVMTTNRRSPDSVDFGFDSFTLRETSAPDTTPPVITLLGDNPLELTVGDSYVEPGATATDDVDGDISGDIVIDASAVDTNTVGSYEVTYNVSDAAGNAATEVIRTVNVSAAPVTDCAPISTLDCSEVPVSIPFGLDWSVDEGGLGDNAGVGTGFTMVVEPSARLASDDPVFNPDVPGYEPSLLAVGSDALTISSTQGIIFSDSSGNNAGNSQINGLGVGIDATSNLVLETTLTDLPAAGTQFQQAGLWFGLNEAEYAKLVVLSGSNGGDWEVQVAYETGDEQQQDPSQNNVTGAGSDITLRMTLDPTQGTVQGEYSVDGGTSFQTVDTLTVPAAFFSGIALPDSSATVSFAGIFTSNRRSTTSLDFQFDSFSIAAPGTTDLTPPVITLLGDNPLELTVGDSYVEPGATATDDVDGDISGDIVIDASAVDTNTVGSYEVTYNVSDAAGNAATEVIRTVNVSAAPDTTPPVITLLGDNPLELTVGDSYVEPGATATDDVDGDISGDIVIDASAVDTNTVGSYEVTYNVSDAAGNAATEVIRTVNVSAAPDTTPPVITLNGDLTVDHEAGTPYTDPGATAEDAVDGPVGVSNDAATAVDVNTLGQYTVTFTAQDAAGNVATATRTVNVVDTIAPVITLNGDATINLFVGDTYVEPGATVEDFETLTPVIGGDTVDTNTPGTYIVTYNAQDSSGNVAEQVTRTVIVTEAVTMQITPASSEVLVGDSFDVTVQIVAGTQDVSGGEANLTFDPTVLEVTQITPVGPFDSVLVSDPDNVAGTIEYAAGVLGNVANGTFDLVTISFTAIAPSAGTDIDYSQTMPSKVVAGEFDVLQNTVPASVIVTNTATLNGSVTLEDRPAAPDAAWSVPLTVTLYEETSATVVETFTVTTDDSGNFTIEGIVPGTYQIAVKNSHTLQVVEVVTLSAGENSVDFGTLLEGDANDDNRVTLEDFGILSLAFGTAEGASDFDPRADFNEDGAVNLSDFSLLSQNYNLGGEVPTP